VLGHDVEPAAIGVVREAVVDQVRDETLDQARITGHGRRFEVRPHLDGVYPCVIFTG
jgi:hypothetical protein